MTDIEQLKQQIYYYREKSANSKRLKCDSCAEHEAWIADCLQELLERKLINEQKNI